jgi:lactococcin 972 family bacteriocin
MKARRKITLALATAGLAASLAVGGAAVAKATTVYPPEGGTWDYGVDYWVMKTWSNYHHPSRVHHSTACSSSACTYSGWVPAGYWSKAERLASWGGNTAYYKVS